jgi:hypothetical protein
MSTPIFVSYSRHQGEWVWDRLVPVLIAGGAEVLIDRERFDAGRPVYRQMDETQDRAGLQILVLSPEYLASKPCQHEMKRAIASSKKFESGAVIPVIRVDCPLPAEIVRHAPLRVDLLDDSKPEPWDLLLRTCRRDLGTSANEWLVARDGVRQYLGRGESVNLVVTDRALSQTMLDRLRHDRDLGLGVVQLDSIRAMHRPALVGAILEQCGCQGVGPVPDKPEDLLHLDRVLGTLPRPPRLALTSFDHVSYRLHNYEFDLFVALRELMQDRKLTLLIESRAPFATLIPQVHPLSGITIPCVELKGRR